MSPKHTNSTHTSAFNTVHILAAVLGVMAAVVLGLGLFFLCRQRSANADDSDEKQTVHQFAYDFETPTVSSQPLTSPPPPYIP
ncbi:hypothetical protein BY458DRAFT_558183 [Sporodiniella umbellata]|nr:hypothetical protein BY458DRAFT_558183 [Sporodiniella umbellata]